jgi:hypothetical protein
LKQIAALIYAATLHLVPNFILAQDLQTNNLDSQRDKAEICYNEKILLKTLDDNFIEIKNNKIDKIQDKVNLKIKVEIINLNKINADELEIISYLNSHQYYNLKDIKNLHYTSIDNKEDVDKIVQNKLVEKINDGIKFYVGKNATISKGGTLDSEHKAILQYEIETKGNFKSSYKAYFGSKNYSTYIKACEKLKNNKNLNDLPNELLAVNKNFKNSGDLTNLFTQIAKRPFDVKIINFNRQNTYGNDVEVSVVTSNDNQACQNSKSVLDNEIRIVKNLDNKNVIDLKNLIINDAYKQLYFRFKITNLSGHSKYFCQSESFATRPKEFIINQDTTTLLGGTSHKMVIKAILDNEKTSQTYDAKLSNDSIKFQPLIPKTCDSKEAKAVFKLIKDQKIVAEFINQKALIKSYTTQNQEFDGIFYPDIGETNLIITDKTWTQIDSEQGDCIKNDSSSIERYGKVGCDISTKETIKLTFIPAKFQVTNFQIQDANEVDKNKTMTYLSQDPKMTAKIKFDLSAMLNNNQFAKLFSSGCYSENVDFSINLNTNPANFIINKRQIQAKDLVIFFEDNNVTKYLIDDKNNLNSIKFLVSKNNFINANSQISIGINFKRDDINPQDPFVLPAKYLDISNIVSQNVKKQDEIQYKTNFQMANFYYARAYAPSLISNQTQINTNIYYAIYCSDICHKQNKNLISDLKIVPALRNWYINKYHTNNFGKALINDTENIKFQSILDLQNGIEYLTIYFKNPTKEQINLLNLPSWLLFGENSFNVSFFKDAKISGGLAFDKNGGKDKPDGYFIDNFNELSSKIQKRLEW